MYGRVVRKYHPKGEAFSLLAELLEAEKLAGCTYDLSVNDFVPEGFWARVRDILAANEPKPPRKDKKCLK